MVKTKKKNIHLPLVVTGYVLFIILLVATLISTTIPLGIALLDPRVLHFNVTVILIAFTIGSLLPVLLGYAIGDKAIKTRSKLSHHFTGILFGLLAYWVTMLLSSFITVPSEFFESNRNVSLLLVNILPSIGVAAIAVILSIAHMRSRHAKQEIIHYRPFAIVFILAIVALPLYLLVQNIATNSVGIYSFLPLIFIAVFGLISYATLRKSKLAVYDKVVWTAISISVLAVALYVVPQFSYSLSNYVIPRPTMETQTAEQITSQFIAVIVWVVYWVKQVKALR